MIVVLESGARKKTLPAESVNLGGAAFLPEWKGYIGPPEGSWSTLKAREDGTLLLHTFENSIDWWCRTTQSC